jgi:hypothetical protein
MRAARGRAKEGGQMESVKLEGRVWGIQRVPGSEHYAIQVGAIFVRPERKESYDRSFFITEEEASRFRVGQAVFIELNQVPEG